MKEKYKAKASGIATFMRRIYRKGLTTTLGGNISCKVGDKMLITPSQVDKNTLKSKHIILMCLDGSIKKTKQVPSMETQLHLNIYKTRSDISAVIHAHPFWGTLAAVSNLQLLNDISDEAFFMINKIAFCDYATMGSVELAKEVQAKIADADILILANHGVVCTGKSLTEALERLEVLENIAHYSYLANQNIEFKHLTDKAKVNIAQKFNQ